MCGVFRSAYGRIPQFSSYGADEQRRPRTEQQRRYVKVQHIDEACIDALAYDVGTSHDDSLEVTCEITRRGDRVGDAGGDEREVMGEPHLDGRPVRDHDQGWSPDLARAIAARVIPALRGIDNVEQPAPHHDRAGGRGRLVQDVGVDGVVAVEGPTVQRLTSDS